MSTEVSSARNWNPILEGFNLANGAQGYASNEYTRFAGRVSDLSLVVTTEADKEGTCFEVVDLWWHDVSGPRKIARLTEGEAQAFAALLKAAPR